MVRRPSYPLGLNIVEGMGGLTLQEQVFRSLRDAIAAGRLAPGSRLPASRAVAAEQGLSRQTVTIAYERLAAEGFVVSRRGAGTFVAAGLPVAMPRQGLPRLRVSQRLAGLLAAPPRRSDGLALPLRPGLPALDHFPLALWHRLLLRASRRDLGGLLDYGEAAGLPALREAIAGYIGAVRGVAARPEQVIVTPGAQGGIFAAALALADPGEAALVEAPGYTGLQAALRLAGLVLRPLPVDAAGCDIGRAQGEGARLALVSPSHHYPLGVTLTMERRLALLAWAKGSGGTILEDDYDGEFRFDQPQVTALHSLEPTAVIYVGTLSKLLAPGLRLGFLVVPEALVEGVSAVRGLLDRHLSLPLQAALADFIGNGHLAAHIRKVRSLYGERRGALLAALDRHCGAALCVSGAAAGLHVLARLPRGSDDRAIAREANAAGLGLAALSDFFLVGRAGPDERGLVVGFGATEASQMPRHAARLATILRRHRPPEPPGAARPPLASLAAPRAKRKVPS